MLTIRPSVRRNVQGETDSRESIVHALIAAHPFRPIVAKRAPASSNVQHKEIKRMSTEIAQNTCGIVNGFKNGEERRDKYFSIF